MSELSLRMLQACPLERLFFTIILSILASEIRLDERLTNTEEAYYQTSI